MSEGAEVEGDLEISVQDYDPHRGLGSHGRRWPLSRACSSACCHRGEGPCTGRRLHLHLPELRFISDHFFLLFDLDLFYSILLTIGIILPFLSQLQGGVNEIDDRKQRDLCATKYKKKDGPGKGKLTEIDKEREEECGICMEITTKFVLPNCSHALCINCYRDCSSFVNINRRFKSEIDSPSSIRLIQIEENAMKDLQ